MKYYLSVLSIYVRELCLRSLGNFLCILKLYGRRLENKRWMKTSVHHVCLAVSVHNCFRSHHVAGKLSDMECNEKGIIHFSLDQPGASLTKLPFYVQYSSTRG